MAKISEDTVRQLRTAVTDQVIIERYWSHVWVPTGPGCWLWTGASSGKGHGQFQIGHRYLPSVTGPPTRKTYVVIAHRFGYAVKHGVDALLVVPILSHRCNNPLCQRPDHWRESDYRFNGSGSTGRRASAAAVT